MPRFMYLLGGVAAVVLVLVLGSRLLGSPTGTVGGPGLGPSPTPEASVAAPSAAAPTASPHPTARPGGGLPDGPFSFEPATPFSSDDSG
ncbi:MAG TPA: hypothetical protein VM344_11140, partial [Vitreimonas sp.]|nr:hypothetical protein [Vitreimonas sp.]